MFVYTLHHRPKSLTDVKYKQTFLVSSMLEKANFLLCMVRYTRIMNSRNLSLLHFNFSKIGFFYAKGQTNERNAKIWLLMLLLGSVWNLKMTTFSNNPLLHLYHTSANDLDGLTILILQDLYTAALLGNCQKQCQFMMHLSQETYLRCRHYM